jgi:beta-carotene 3-hydroxylase
VTPWLLAAGAALAMEPLAALAHRRWMHGSGWRLHASHHRPPAGRLEANDLFPAGFALATVAAMALGASVAAARPLLWVGAGVTVYGLAYLVVHDLCTHRRLHLPVPALRYLRWVAAAHAVHHRSGREPYGFLLPRVPAEARDAVTAARTVDRATAETLRAVDTLARPLKTS